VDEWNAPGNAENRATVSEDGDYQAAEVNVVSIAHAAEGLSGEGCAFLSTTTPGSSRSTACGKGRLRWGPRLRGSWSEEQQDGTQDNAVRDDWTLEGR
jgi:hypothetical protein